MGVQDMLTATYWVSADDVRTVSAPTWGQLFDAAVADGARRIQDPNGGILRCICGEWCYMN